MTPPRSRNRGSRVFRRGLEGPFPRCFESYTSTNTHSFVPKSELQYRHLLSTVTTETLLRGCPGTAASTESSLSYWRSRYSIGDRAASSIVCWGLSYWALHRWLLIRCLLLWERWLLLGWIGLLILPLGRGHRISADYQSDNKSDNSQEKPQDGITAT